MWQSTGEQYVPLKRRWASTEPYGVTTHTTVLFIIIIIIIIIIIGGAVLSP
jgi:hypothetical protein